MPKQEPNPDNGLWGRVRPTLQDLLTDLRPGKTEDETEGGIEGYEEGPSQLSLFDSNTDSYLYGFLHTAPTAAPASTAAHTTPTKTYVLLATSNSPTSTHPASSGHQFSIFDRLPLSKAPRPPIPSQPMPRPTLPNAQRQAAAAAFCAQYQRTIASKRGGQAKNPEDAPAWKQYVFGMEQLGRARPDISAVVSATTSANPQEHSPSTSMVAVPPGLSTIDVRISYLRKSHLAPNHYQVHLYGNLPLPRANVEILAAMGAMSR